jgi:hypothetical protein
LSNLSSGWGKKEISAPLIEKNPFLLVNTLLLCICLFLVNTLLLHIQLLALTRPQTDRQNDRETNTLAAHGLEDLFSSCAVVSVFLVAAKNSFLVLGGITEKLPIFLVNTLLLHIPLLVVTHPQTERQNDRETNQSWLGWVTYWFLQVNSGWAG